MTDPEERLKEAEKDIKLLQIGQTEIKKDLQYVKLAVNEQKITDNEILKKLDEHSIALNTLTNTRTAGKRIMEIVLGGLLTGCLALIAWFAKEALK